MNAVLALLIVEDIFFKQNVARAVIDFNDVVVIAVMQDVVDEVQITPASAVIFCILNLDNIAPGSRSTMSNIKPFNGDA